MGVKYNVNNATIRLTGKIMDAKILAMSLGDTPEEKMTAISLLLYNFPNERIIPKKRLTGII